MGVKELKSRFLCKSPFKIGLKFSKTPGQTKHRFYPKTNCYIIHSTPHKPQRMAQVSESADKVEPQRGEVEEGSGQNRGEVASVMKHRHGWFRAGWEGLDSPSWWQLFVPGIKGIEVGASGMIWSQDLAKLFVSLIYSLI